MLRPAGRVMLVSVAMATLANGASALVVSHLTSPLASRRGLGLTLRRGAAPLCNLAERQATTDAAKDSERLQGILSRMRAREAAKSSYSAERAEPKDDNTGEGRGEGAALMFAVALLWGSNFPAVKATIEAGLPGSVAAASRFSIAALALLPLLRTSTPLPPELVRGGLECGAWLALGYIAQALALHDLPAGAVAFLASLQVVFVPMLSAALGKGSLSARLAAAACLSVSGVALLEIGGLSDLGDSAGAAAPIGATLLALLQPVGFGTSYLRIEGLMAKFPTCGLQLSALQLASNAAIALCWLALDATILGGGGGGAAAGGGGGGGGAVLAGSLSLGSLDLSALSSPSVIGGILYTGLISTALTVLLQTRALGKLPASDSSVIVATEPLWAAGFASILLNEQLEPSAQLGGGLIVLGCLSNTLLPPDLGLGELGLGDLGLRRGDEEAEAGTAKAMEEETEQEAEAEEDLHL